jgi:hypothetical protein
MVLTAAPAPLAPRPAPALRAARPRPRGAAGFTLVESLIGAALLLLVMIGVLPLFTRAMIDNMAGADYTKIANMAKSRHEDFARAPFDGAAYNIPAGQTSTVIDEYWDMLSSSWQPTPSSGKLPNSAAWERTTTVTQYTFADALDNGVLDTPLDGGTAGEIMQAQVLVKSVNPAGAGAVGPLGSRRQTIVRFLKAF